MLKVLFGGTYMDLILKEINNIIKSIWVNDIKLDYDNGHLLKEDTLKNSLYFHLRTKLSDILEENDLRIFTEYNSGIFKGTEYRPDMVIAKVDFDCDSNNYEDWIQECLCIIEIKYKQGFHSSESISKDFDKIKLYIENFKSDCQYYMATIWEYEDEATSWIDNDEWAKGKLTELNASFENDEMRFYVIQH